MRGAILPLSQYAFMAWCSPGTSCCVISVTVMSLYHHILHDFATTHPPMIKVVVAWTFIALLWSTGSILYWCCQRTHVWSCDCQALRVKLMYLSVQQYVRIRVRDSNINVTSLLCCCSLATSSDPCVWPSICANFTIIRHKYTRTFWKVSGLEAVRRCYASLCIRTSNSVYKEKMKLWLSDLPPKQSVC